MMFTFRHCRRVVIHFVFFGKLFNSSLTYLAKHRLICKIIFVNISASPFCQWFAKSFGCEHFPTYGILTYVWYAVNWPSSHHHVVTQNITVCKTMMVKCGSYCRCRVQCVRTAGNCAIYVSLSTIHTYIHTNAKQQRITISYLT